MIAVQPHPHVHTFLRNNQGFWDDDRERVYLVGVALKREGKARNRESAVAAAAAAAGGNAAVAGYGIDESLEELGRLADTAGLKVCEVVRVQDD